jgi:hypothetical protein
LPPRACARIPVASILGLSTLLPILAPVPSAMAGEMRLTPVLTLSEGYSTNVDLEPDGEEDSAWITRITPGAGLRGEGSRGTVAFDGSVTLRHQTAGDDKGFNQDVDLSGLIEAELARDLLFLDAAASVSQQVLQSQEANSTSNQDTVQVYRVSPALRHGLGSFAVGELRYALDQVFVASGDVSNETQHSGILSISSLDDIDRLRWSLNGRISEAIRTDADNVSRSDVELAGDYAATRPVHLIGGVGYQTFDDHDTEDFQSPTWRAGLRIHPNRRLDLQADYGLRDDEYSPAFQLRYQIGRRTRLIASYQETLATSQQRLASTLGFIGLDPETGAFIDKRAGTPFDPRIDPFDIDDETSRIKEFRSVLLHERGRNQFSIAGGYGKDNTLGSGDDDETSLQLDLGWTRRLDRRTTLDAGVGYDDSEFADSPDDQEYLFQGGVRYGLTERTGLFAGYLFHFQTSDEQDNEFNEHLITVGIRHRF